MLDRNFDAQVERTQNRPLASNRISLSTALYFLFIQIIVAIFLAWQLDRGTFLLALMGGAMTLIYPLLKRWTYWPQLWLGFIINWGLLMGLVAQRHAIHWAGLMLYGGCIFLDSWI